MGSVRKINSEYFIEFFARGLKYQQKIGPDKTKAQKALQDIEAKIANGEAAIIVRDVDLDIFFQDFLENLAPKHFPKTIQRYQSTITHFQHYLRLEHPSLQQLSAITPRIIEEYKLYVLKNFRPGNSSHPNIVNLTLILLRDFLQYAIQLGYLSDNPVLYIRFVSVSRSVSRILNVLTNEEFTAILNSIPGDFKLVVEFMLFTGLRSWELVGLKWSQVDWETRCLIIPWGIIKLPSVGQEKLNNGNLKDRRIPLQPRAQEILRKYQQKTTPAQFVFSNPSGQRWEREDFEKKLQKIFMGCPLKKPLSFTVLRHSFAVSLIRKGVSFSKLYTILGKTDIARMMIYSSYFETSNLDG